LVDHEQNLRMINHIFDGIKNKKDYKFNQDLVSVGYIFLV